MAQDRSHASAEFKARKLAVQKRLTTEGRWKEASDFKETVRLGCKAAGMGADASVQASWDEMERNYPPLSESAAAAAKVVEQDGGGGLVQESVLESVLEPVVVSPVVVNVSNRKKQERAIAVRIPEEWGELPATAKYEDEVEWVYQNYVFAIEHLPSGDRMKLGRAKTPAPSMGAVGMLSWAMDNRTAFYKDVVPRIKREAVEGEGEAVHRERMAVGEIRQILEQMGEVKE
jgi:hypothetical protein